MALPLAEGLRDAQRRISSSEWVACRRKWQRTVEGGDDRIGVAARQHIPARFDGLRPLRGVAKRHAGNSQEERLLLDTPGIGRDALGSVFEREHVQIANRIYLTHRAG